MPSASLRRACAERPACETRAPDDAKARSVPSGFHKRARIPSRSRRRSGASNAAVPRLPTLSNRPLASHQIACAPAHIEAGDPFDPALLEELAPAADRVVVKQQRMGDLLTRPSSRARASLTPCSTLQRKTIVIDPFCGSGATILAAERTGRRGYGVEIDPVYVDATIARWEKMTGRQARHASGKTFAELKAACAEGGVEASASEDVSRSEGAM